MSPEPDHVRGDSEHKGDDNGNAVDGAGTSGGQWEQVENERMQLVEDLNRNAVSFTMPSAEGITMYRGIDAHSNNGKMRSLARAGLRTLVAQIKAEEVQAHESARTAGNALPAPREATTDAPTPSKPHTDQA